MLTMWQDGSLSAAESAGRCGHDECLHTGAEVSFTSAGLAKTLDYSDIWLL